MESGILAAVLTHQRRLVLGVILLVALLLRVGWGLAQPAAIDQRLPDQREYLELSRNLLAGHGLKLYDDRFQQEVHAYRTPGYPLFLAATGGSVRWARLVQALLDTSTVLAVYLLARRWLEQGPSLLASIAVALNPFLIYFSGLILSETLFVCMLVWGMTLLIWRRNYVWGGLLLALSVLVRPSALFLPVLLGLSAVFITVHPREVPARRPWLRVPAGATMLLLTALVLLPWAWRNHRILGHWVFLTTNGGITRYDGFNPIATGASDQRFVQDKEMRHVRAMDEFSRDRFFSARADEYIQETWQRQPVWLLKLTLLKIARTWSPMPLSDDFGRPLYVVIGLVYTVPLFLMAIGGVLYGGLPRPAKWFLLAPAVYITVIHAISVGSLRYRLPAEPLLAILAASLVVPLFIGRRPPDSGTPNEGVRDTE